MEAKNEQKGWFSIKEAAKKLSIGEPTLYRWMRDAKITFRKVGDSTRFLQEDLDAVVEVHHSQKDLSKVTQVCPLCHGDKLIKGGLQSTGRSYFRPDESTFWTLKDANIKTHTRMCARCGYLLVFGDTEKLAELTEKNKTEEGDGSPCG